MQGAAVNAANLSCRRGDRILFARLGFALAAGQALQVRGANGIGKSSLLRTVAGLSRPFDGTVEVEGATGLMDERPALDPSSTLQQALAFWARMDAPLDPAHLARLGLAPLLDVPVRYLSTGQKKRAAFARLLGQKADVWLLDEPLNGLDGAAAALAQTMTAEHCARGGIALIASHQPFEIPGLRILALEDYAA